MAHKQLNTVLRRAAGPPAAQGVTDARLLERYVASRDEAAVNVKAKTGEKVGHIGRAEAIACQAVVLIEERKS